MIRRLVAIPAAAAALALLHVANQALTDACDMCGSSRSTHAGWIGRQEYRLCADHDHLFARKVPA